MERVEIEGSVGPLKAVVRAFGSEAVAVAAATLVLCGMLWAGFNLLSNQIQRTITGEEQTQAILREQMCLLAITEQSQRLRALTQAKSICGFAEALAAMSQK